MPIFGRIDLSIFFRTYGKAVATTYLTAMSFGVANRRHTPDY